MSREYIIYHFDKSSLRLFRISSFFRKLIKSSLQENSVKRQTKWLLRVPCSSVQKTKTFEYICIEVSQTTYTNMGDQLKLLKRIAQVLFKNLKTSFKLRKTLSKNTPLLTNPLPP